MLVHLLTFKILMEFLKYHDHIVMLSTRGEIAAMYSKFLCDNPIITPSSVSAVTVSSSGRVDLSTISEWYRVASITGLGNPLNK